MARGNRSSRSPATVVHRAGLSSAINARIVEKILQESLPGDIALLLSRIGFRQPPSAGGERQTSRRGEQHLPLTDEQKRSARLQAAHEYVASAEGMEAIVHLKAMLLARQVASDDDLIARECRDAVRRRVEEWMSSPRGRESVQQLSARMIEEKVIEQTRSLQKSWIQKAIADVTSDNGHSIS